MRILTVRILLIVVICLGAAECFSQSAVSYFSPLSAAAYPDKAAAIAKRSVPVVYPDKKDQKRYADIIADRNESLADDFKNNRVIKDSLLLDECNRIIQRLRNANKSFPYDSVSAFISRSVAANASSWGEGTLFVNLGMFLWLDNEDELALVIGHELSHQFLNHSESKIRKNIALFSSEDFQEELKSIKKSSDGKYERFKNLMKDLVVKSGTHSRYKETEADSLGMIMTRNAGYNVKNAAVLLLKLDNVDDLFVSGKLYNVKAALQKAGADSFLFTANKRYNGLSMATVTMNADKEFDSVKTHPDCIVRWRKLTGDTKNDTTVNCCTALTPSMASLKQRAMAELVRNAYENNHLTLCIHLCLFAQQNGYTQPYYNYYISAAFSGIIAADKHFEKFSATDAKAPPNSTLKELQDLIFKANTEKLETLAKWYLENGGGDSSDDHAFAKLMYDTQVKLKDVTASQASFRSAFPDSKYIYLFTLKNQ